MSDRSLFLFYFAIFLQPSEQNSSRNRRNYAWLTRNFSSKLIKALLKTMIFECDCAVDNESGLFAHRTSLMGTVLQLYLCVFVFCICIVCNGDNYNFGFLTIAGNVTTRTKQSVTIRQTPRGKVSPF